MRNLIWELGHAARRLRRRPRFALVVIVTLAGAIAINATLASAVSALLVRPLPVENPEEIARIFERSRDGRIDQELSWEQFELARESGVFSGVTAFDAFEARVEVGSIHERVAGELVSSSFFEMLGVRTVRGRSFLPTEGIAAGDAPVVVLGAELAAELFGTSPVPGGTIEINDVPFTVIGVAEPRFRGTSFALTRQIWIPATMREAVQGKAWPGSSEDRWLSMLARVPSPGSIGAAEDLLNAHRDRTRGAGDEWSFRVLPERAGAINPEAPGAVRIAAGAALGIGIAILVVACANAAGLLVTRLATRTSELGIRMALGADRARLAREGLAENALLVAASSVTGLLFASWATRLYPALLPAAASRVTIDFSLDWRVAGYTIGAAATVALALSIVPLIHARRIDLVAMIVGRTGRERRSRVEVLGAIAAVQIALALATLMAAALFVQAMVRYQKLDPGFAQANRVVMRIDPGTGPGNAAARLEAVRETLQASPAVRSAAFAAGAPLAHLPTSVTIGETERTRVDSTAVGPGFFALLEIPLFDGRSFLQSDTLERAPVAIVNQTFARRWGATAGTTVRLAGLEHPVTIVGIVADTKIVALAEAPAPHLYVPLAQRPIARPALLVELEPGVAMEWAAAREIVEAELGPGSVAAITSMNEVVEADRHIARIGALLSTSAALAGTGLSILALWTILATAVARSRRELAIRMAVGAAPRHIIAAVSRRGAGALAAGGVAGSLLALVAMRALAPLLIPGGTIAWWSVAAPLATITGLAMLAALGPVRRALALDPARSLREQ